MKKFAAVALALAFISLPALAYAQASDGSAGGSAPQASIATATPASIATSTPATSVSAPAPLPAASSVPAPVHIQLATVTIDTVIPASTTSARGGLTALAILVAAGVIGAVLFLRARKSDSGKDDAKCDDIRSLLEEKKKELEEYLQNWPEEKLKEVALDRAAGVLEKQKRLGAAVHAARDAKEAYDKIQETIETLQRRYDLCMLSFPSVPNRDIEVRASPIEGKGVFALRDFSTGERIVEWGERKVVTLEEAAALSEDFQRRYMSEKDGKRLLSSEPMRYVNHSCDPNTKPKDNGDVAIRDIRSGEEITSDYRSFGHEGVRCHCGALKCRGVL